MAKVPAFFSKLSKNLETAVLASEIALLEVNNVIKLPDVGLNWATGGIPSDRITVLAGESGAGKTFLACLMLGQLMKDRPNDYAVYLDIERYFWNKPERVKRLEQFGIDLERLQIISTNKVDEVFKCLTDIENGLKDSRGKNEAGLCAIIADSLGGLRTQADEDKFAKEGAEAAANKFGGMAKIFGNVVKKLVAISADNNVASILIQHAIQEQGMGGPAGAPPKMIITGGQKLRYMADVMLLLLNVNRKDAGLQGNNEAIAISDKDFVKVGKTIKCQVSKTRSTVEGRVVEYQANFETCEIVNTNKSLFNLAVKLGVVYHPLNSSGKESTHYWAFKDDTGKEYSYHGQAQAIEALKDLTLFEIVSDSCMTAKTTGVEIEKEDTIIQLGDEE